MHWVCVSGLIAGNYRLTETDIQALKQTSLHLPCSVAQWKHIVVSFSAPHLCWELVSGAGWYFNCSSWCNQRWHNRWRAQKRSFNGCLWGHGRNGCHGNSVSWFGLSVSASSNLFPLQRATTPTFQRRLPSTHQVTQFNLKRCCFLARGPVRHLVGSCSCIRASCQQEAVGLSFVVDFALRRHWVWASMM